MEPDKIFDAVKRARAFRLCLRRIWAVAASLPDRERSLPSLIPVPDMFPVPGHDRQHHEHEQCTFDFCEHSRVDFTSVAQHHEKCEEGCGQITFPLSLLDERVAGGKPTAWKLDDLSLLDTPHPYMAVSHVWADGTGSGTWGPGKVNKCLYRFLCDIARHFQCEGCWWDTISIPTDDEARGQALNNMQNNYADARITLVHDLYLREWEWVNAETACFAIVMSPWYSRGWTSLELAKSHKVKILFKARNDEHVLKDLDVDILAEIHPSSRHHATAESIRKLRSASIQSFGDLLAILGPRDTSKPRDVPIISGLLAGVDVSGGLSQQEIYQRILRKLGKIAQGHLFHNSATMSAPGFSWCPTNILDMPMAESSSALLDVLENGDLEGFWRVCAIDSVKSEDFIWKDTHPLMQVSLKLALTGESKNKHLLLVEKDQSRSRALLVKPMRGDQEITTMLCCHFVGPVYFRSALGGSNNDERCRETRVRIGSIDGMKELQLDAWGYVCSIVEKNKVADEVSFQEDTGATGRGVLSSQSQTPFDEDDTISMGSKDWKALLYFAKNPSASLLDESQKLQLSKDSESKPQESMALYFMRDQDSQAFLYGHQDIVPYIKTWLNQNPELKAGSIMLLVLDGDDNIKDDSGNTPARDSLASDALLLATAQKEEDEIELLVTLLLDNHAQHNTNLCGQTPLHLAVEHKCVRIAKSLLTNKTNPANVDVLNAKKQSAIHIAAQKGHYEVVQLLVEHSKRLNAQEREMDRTALHLAAAKGYEEIVQHLIDRNADPKVSDLNGEIALHYAARRGHTQIVSALLKHASEINTLVTSSYPTAVNSDEKIDDKPDREADEWSGGETNERTSRDNHSKSDEKNDEKRDLDIQNDQGQTALHLAAQEGHISVVKVLIDYGAKVCATDERGQTALRLAAKKKGYVEIVEMLLNQKNSASFKQKELDNALLLAAVAKDRETVEMLHEGGARSGLQDLEGRTALHLIIGAKLECNIEPIIQRQEDLDKQDYTTRQSALLLAAEKGVKNVVAELVKKGANVKLKDSKDRTALHWAAIRRNVDIIDILLKTELKSLVKEPDSLGRTALHWAALSGSTQATRLMLNAGAHHITEDKYGRSALILAACSGRAAAVKTLLDNGSDPKAHDKDRKTALDWAATIGSEAVVHELLPKIGADDAKKRALELATNGGHVSVATLLAESIKDTALRASALPTVLFLASASTKHLSVAQRLIERVTDPNHKDKQGRTALMLAVENKNERVMRDLLSNNAKTDLQNKDGSTALMIATRLDDVDAVKELLLAKANPDVQDNRSYTALHYAVEQGSIESIRKLLEYGAKPEIPDSRNRTTLHIAMEKLRPRSGFLVRIYGDRWDRILSVLIQQGSGLSARDEQGWNVLHWAVLKLRKDILRSLIIFGQGYDLDTQDAQGRTPLQLAVEKGYNFPVAVLLRYGFKPNVQDKMGQTPLLLAAERGIDRSVQSLLNNKANPNLPDLRGRTPLSQAAQNGHKTVVEILFDNKKAKPNVDARDAMGRTALLLAAENGHAAIVQNLLDQKANSTIMDCDGKKAWQKAMDKGHASVVDKLLSVSDTPIQDRKTVDQALLLASRRGWVTLVKVLLGKEADVTFQSREGWTALHMAAMSGHQEVVQMLVEKGISIIIKDKQGRTALMKATEHGFESIVNLLVGREEVKTNIDGWMGPEALLFAAEKGYTGIVKLLLVNSVDCNTFDSARRTAMALAAANGNRAIVELLLKQNASSTIKDDYNRTVLHHAAWGGYDDVVGALLENGVDFSALDSRGQSALHLAAERGSEKVVERLLEKRANVNAKSKDGQTVLHRAAWGGSCEVVRLLRQNGADPSIRDNSENKPWQVAAEKGHESVAQALLEEEESVSDERIATKKGLIFAAQMGYAGIARSLLKKGAESAVKDKDGLTPLHWATERGDSALVDLLIREGEGLINAQDYQRRTALCLGVQKARAAVVEILLRNNADANIPDENGQTVLHHAAQKGNWEIVQILLKHEVDPHLRDFQKKKAWQLAAEAGSHQIVRLLLEIETDLNPQSQRKEELFLKMAAEGVVPMVQVLLEKGVNKDAKDRFGRGAIGLAAEYGRDETLELLLSKGADLNVADLRQQTPLLWAAKAGNSRIISSILNEVTRKSSKALMEPCCDEDDAGPSDTTTNSTEKASYKANIVNHTDCEGRTALLVAVEKECDDAVKVLLDKGSPGIDVNVRDMTGETALHLAAERGNLKLVQLLLKKKAKQDIQDNLGRTALHLAAEQGKDHIVEALLESSSCSLNEPDSRKRTALHVATERGNKDIVESLLGNRADANCTDERGRTALLLAAENGDKEIVDLLLKNGATQEHRDMDGRTPLLLAVATGDKAVVKTLLDHPKYDLEAKDSHDRSLLHLAVQSGNKEVAWLIAEQITSNALQ